MSAHALAQGGLRSAEFLPPSLQPNPIATSAPGTDRGLSLLLSCLLYSAFAALIVVAARNPKALAQILPTHTDVIFDHGDAVIDPVPQPPPPPALSRLAAPPVQSTPPETIISPPSEAVPETPLAMPTVDMSHAGVKPADSANPNLFGANSDSTYSDRRVGDPPPPGRPIVLDVDFSALKATVQVQPSYPPLARLIHAQGPVVLQMTIDAQGVPTDVRLISSPHQSLDAESLRVARLWRFEPARLDGRAVAAQFRLTLNFILKR